MFPLLFRRFTRRVVRTPSGALRVAILLFATLLYGSTGYVFFELPVKPELTWPDGLWWSIVTVTTVGYGDYFPTTAGGRFLVAAPLMFFGIGLLGYVVSLATSALVEARSKERMGMSAIKHEGHLVIFNFPGLAKLERVIDELRHDEEFGNAHELVLVDDDLTELPPELLKRNIHFVKGNPARDETLERANIDHATHAIVLVKDATSPHADANNLIITLAIEARTRAIRTTVECVEASAAELLKKAGCDSVVCLARFDGHFIGNEVLQPGMQSVIDALLSTATADQLMLSPVGTAKTFGDVSEVCRSHGHLPLGILRGTKSMMNAKSDLKLEPADRVISIGAERLR